MKHIKFYEEIGNPAHIDPTEIQKFTNDFLDSINDYFPTSMFMRMLKDNSYSKFGKKVYNLSEEQKTKLQSLIPSFEKLLTDVQSLKDSIK